MCLLRYVFVVFACVFPYDFQNLFEYAAIVQPQKKRMGEPVKSLPIRFVLYENDYFVYAVLFSLIRAFFPVSSRR